MPRCPVLPARPDRVRTGPRRPVRPAVALALTAGLAAPAGLLTALPAQAQVAPVSLDALADGCGLTLTADVEREVLLAVTSLPLGIELVQLREVAPDPEPGPSSEPGGTAEPDPPVEPVPTAASEPSAEPEATAVPEPPGLLLLGTEPRVVGLVPATGAGTDDAYRVLVNDPETLAPLLDVDLALPLCAEPSPSPSPTVTPNDAPGVTPAAEPTAAPTATPEPSESATPSAAGDGATPDPAASPEDGSPSAPIPMLDPPAEGELGGAGPMRVAARQSPPVAFARLLAIGPWSRAVLPELLAASALPQVAPDAAVPAPVVASPPETTGVRLPAPPDWPPALVTSLPDGAAPRAPAPVLLTQGGPPAGLADALPAALLAAAAGAGFLAAQLRRRVPLRRS